MFYRESASSKIFDAANYIFMIFLILVMIYPLLNIIAISLSKAGYVDMGVVSWFPRGFNLHGYDVILQKPLLYISYRNTILYAAAGTFLTLLLTSMMAYPLAVRNFQAKAFITVFLAITMFFSGGLIPTYLLIKNLQLLNTFWVMVLPFTIGAFNVIMFRTFFQNIPTEMRESAFMDGASDLRILFWIYLPLSKALLATFGLFTTVWYWNEWFSALIYLNDEDKITLQMFLRSIILPLTDAKPEPGTVSLVQKGLVSPKNIQMAAIIITMLPILCVYPFIQKYFVKGVMIGAIKG